MRVVSAASIVVHVRDSEAVARELRVGVVGWRGDWGGVRLVSSISFKIKLLAAMICFLFCRVECLLRHI